MSLMDRLREGLFRVRIVPKQTDEDVTNFTNKQDSLPNRINEAVEAGERLDLSELVNITTLTGDRNEKYAIFEEMVADGRIGAAIEMYANDTVQYNPEGKVIWVESDNSDVAAYCNKLIEDLNIPDNIWSYAYCMWLYGDVYLETFKNTSNRGNKPTLLLEPSKVNNNVRLQADIEGSILERYVEKVPNPADIYDLQYKGKTSGFIKDADNRFKGELSNGTYMYNGVSTDIDVLNPTKFVHICLSPNISRFPEKFNLTQKSQAEKVTDDGYIDGSDSEGSGSSLSFTVLSGQSVLQNVYGPYKTLKLKEESVLLERVTKSSITRIVQIELGDLPEAQKRRKLQEIKNQIEQQIQLNKTDGTITSRAGAQPIENIIYTTTKDGKGAISTTNIGGDVDIGNLDDINQSENKVYGALLTPKALLGADMDGSGLSNGGSLTEMNTTYARRIKRGQLALTTGIKNLINIFALSEKVPDVVNNFTVKLTPIITVEDNRRDELLQNKIRNVNDMLSLLDNIELIDESTKLEIILNWLGSYLSQQDIVDIINKYLKETEKEETDEKYDDQLEDMDVTKDNDREMSGPPSSSSFPPLNDTTEEETTNEEPGFEPPELSNQEDLADIEGEDLL